MDTTPVSSFLTTHLEVISPEFAVLTGTETKRPIFTLYGPERAEPFSRTRLLREYTLDDCDDDSDDDEDNDSVGDLRHGMGWDVTPGRRHPTSQVGYFYWHYSPPERLNSSRH